MLSKFYRHYDIFLELVVVPEHYPNQILGWRVLSMYKCMYSVHTCSFSYQVNIVKLALTIWHLLSSQTPALYLQIQFE